MAKKDWICMGADGLTFGERLGDLISSRGITQSQLADETGVNQSAISEYINGKQNGTLSRAPDCATIISLAKYFSVSTDYLLGLTRDPAIKKSAVDELGISPKAVEWIEIFAKNDTECFDHNDTASVFNSLLEDESFTVFFYQLCSFFYAKRAEYIYESLLTQEFPIGENGIRTIPHEEMMEFNCKVNKALKNTAFPNDIPDDAKREDYLPHEIADYLEAILELEDSEPGDSDFIDALAGLYGLHISELPELRARKAFDGLMRTLDRHAEIEGELGNIPQCLSEAMR